MNYLEWKKRAFLSAGGGSWFLPSGIDIADCIAAYQFIGAESKAMSCHDWTEHGYELTMDWITWSAEDGISSGDDNGRVNQVDLSNRTDVITQVVRYKNYEHIDQETAVYPLTNLKFRSVGTPMLSLWMQFEYKNHASPEDHLHNAGNGYWGAVLEEHPYETSSGNYLQYRWATSNEYAPSSGVVGFDRNHVTLWKNGSQMQNATVEECKRWDGNPNFLDEDRSTPLVCRYHSPYRGGGHSNILAAVFFKVSLSAAQHQELYEKMSQLGD